jgi:hypothetical protein
MLSWLEIASSILLSPAFLFEEPDWIFAMRSLKQSLIVALGENDLEAAVAIVKHQRQALSVLIRIAYDKDTLAGWRAIKAIGLAAREMAKTDAEFLRETCRKLLWSLTDESGAIGWSAPEILGEIVSAEPRRYPDIIPIIAGAYEVEEEVFRAGVVYALCRVAEAAPELAVTYQKIVMLSLADKEPLVKVNGLELVGLLWPVAVRNNVWSLEYQERIRSAVQGLLSDRGEAWVYKGDDFLSIQVGEMASKVAKFIN